MTSSLWNWLLFTLIQRDKVKWVCVTLNECYLRSANRGSNNLYRFLIKIYQISLQWKDKFFWSVFFTVFFRLPIYESIAAIFWQSASYVLIIIVSRLWRFCFLADIVHLPHSQKWLPLSEFDFSLIERDKVKLVCVSLIEGYLGAANRKSHMLYRFLIKI